jgi:hypothetical protein
MIARNLDMMRGGNQRYQKTAAYGHFGRDDAGGLTVACCDPRLAPSWGVHGSGLNHVTVTVIGPCEGLVTGTVDEQYQ